VQSIVQITPMSCRHTTPTAITRFSSNAKRLLAIDRFLGAPICWLLTILRLSEEFQSRNLHSNPKNILFIKLAEQGSTVLAYDALSRAVEKVGANQVYFLAFEENRFVVDLLKLIPKDNVLTIDTRSPIKMVTSCVSRLIQMHKLKIEACVDLEFFARSSAIIAFLSGARSRIGFHTYFGEGPYRGNLFTHRILYNPHLHTSVTFTSLVIALEADPNQLPTYPLTQPSIKKLPEFIPTIEEKNKITDLLRYNGIPTDAPLIILNANASDLLPLRKWDQSNYVALARQLIEQYQELYIAFTGSSLEAEQIESLVNDVNSARCISIAGKTSLRELLVVYSMAHVLVTNDSGPAHFAALTSIDTISLFGPETPLLFSAPNPRSHPLWAGLACSPCVNAFNSRQTTCTNNKCMQAIKVDQVYALLVKLYETRTGLHT
jgi:ADP-heptose:LPS heptosyltransferase